MTDAKALKHRSRFFSSITKQHSISQIKALRINNEPTTDPTKITNHLTQYLEHIAKAPPAQEDLPPLPASSPNPELDIMEPPDEDEIKAIVIALNSSSEAGTISPRLLKLATTHTWDIPYKQPRAEKRAAAYHARQHMALHPDLPSPPPQAHTTPTPLTRTYTPFRGLRILTKLTQA
jgi:hypothetical protein